MIFRIALRKALKWKGKTVQSLYYGISSENFIDVVRPELKDEYLAKIYGSCHIEKIEANSEYWYQRQCCSKHEKYDRRTCD